jgi:hypothetical protein
VSDTPRTDALSQSGKAHYMALELCRDLERELNAANKRSFDLEKVMRLVVVRCEHLHHPWHHRHGVIDECPVEAEVRRVVDGGGR